MSQVFLRSPQIASRAFGTDSPGQYMTAVPRTKFEFYVQFVLSSGASTMLQNANLNTYDGSRGLTFKVKTAEKPKINLVTEDLNQYNKKVVAYKKIEYQEASLSLYDTIDDSPLATWVDYFTYYFADSRRNYDPTKAQLDYLQSPVEAQFQLGAGWGFLPLLDQQTNFFDAIIIYALFGNTYTAFSYMNPKITSMDWGSKDYTSSDPEEVAVSFKYEAIDYFAFGQPIGYDPYGFMTNFGFVGNGSSSQPTSTLAVQNTATPRIFTQPFVSSSTQQVQVVQSNNVSNPTTPLPVSTQPSAQVSASAAPGATAPTPIATNSALSQSLNFGTSPNINTNTFAAKTITQQIGQQSGQIAITSNGGGQQYVNTLNGTVLNLPPVSSALLSNPPQSTNPAISSTALALAQGYYGSTVPQSLVQSIASVAAYVSATQNVPVSSLLGPNGVTDSFIASYNTLAPVGSKIGLTTVQSPPWPNNPTLRGSISAAYTDPA